MKKVLLVTLLALMMGGLNSCATYGTSNSKKGTSDSKKWLEYELPPSKVSHEGDVFFTARLSDGSNFGVYFDNEISNDDDTYYYTILMQEFGWRPKSGTDGETWTGSDPRYHKFGHIYINPNRLIAVYFSTKTNKYSVFKVKIN